MNAIRWFDYSLFSSSILVCCTSYLNSSLVLFFLKQGWCWMLHQLQMWRLQKCIWEERWWVWFIDWLYLAVLNSHQSSNSACYIFLTIISWEKYGVWLHLAVPFFSQKHLPIQVITYGINIKCFWKHLRAPWISLFVRREQHSKLFSLAGYFYQVLFDWSTCSAFFVFKSTLRRIFKEV